MTNSNARQGWGRAGLVSVSASVFLACGYARTPYLLDTLNKGVTSGAVPPRPSPRERVSLEVVAHLEDSYFSPDVVATWMDAAGQATQPLAQQLDCLRSPPLDPSSCYRKFDLVAPSLWSLPAAPATPSAGGGGEAASLTEMDVERFLANARWVASSLLVLEHSLGRPLTASEVSTGIADGMQRARAYIAARHWRRDPKRPTTALVLSGGGATGAFTAGFVWRLMEVLRGCHGATGADACPDAKIDLIVGTSTGTLVGTLVDLFAVPNQAERAEKLLVDNYTCSVERDLYCKYDVWDWRLAENQRGLMHFNGIEQKLAQALSPELQANESELVTLTLDYDSGEIFAQSDQDPEDGATGPDRVQTVLASIVEPVLSDPVDYVMRDGKKRPGTFIDGGVRSGLPLRQAVWRGAERALVISTSSIDVEPNAHAQAALPILMRTIDLATSQNLAGELQSAEFEAGARRLAEYDVCTERIQWGDANARVRFCQRRDLWAPVAGPQAQAAAFIGPGLFAEVAKSWKSVWVNRPENGAPAAIGYSFDPHLMRRLFDDGVRTFQARCQEALGVLNVPAQVRASSGACALSADTAVALAEQAFQPLASCHADDHEIPECR